MSMFRFTHAVVCRIPNSFAKNAVGTSGVIDLELARKQHEMYIQSLRSIALDVVELPADENHPDCLFVEDTAIVCNGSALICKPGHPSRKNEVFYMKNILEKELKLPIIEIEDENATLDGGDVLFTGKEFFVGVSSRTNTAGAAAVAKAFPEFPCSPIKLTSGLHLKSGLSMAGPDVICVGADTHSQEVVKRIEKVASFRYQTLTVPDTPAANVLFANGCLFYRDNYPESSKIFQEKMSHWDLKPLPATETEKADGLLTCSCILIRKTKKLKNIM